MLLQASGKGKKLHGMSTAEQKRLNKLPPRLAKVKAEAFKERKHTTTTSSTTTTGGATAQKSLKADRGGAGDASLAMQQQQLSSAGGAGSRPDKNGSFMIESWDNAMAKGIPEQATSQADVTNSSAAGGCKWNSSL